MYITLLLVCLPLTQHLSYQHHQSLPVESNFNEFKVAANASIIASMPSPSAINIHTFADGLYHLSQTLAFGELVRHFEISADGMLLLVMNANMLSFYENANETFTKTNQVEIPIAHKLHQMVFNSSGPVFLVYFRYSDAEIIEVLTESGRTFWHRIDSINRVYVTQIFLTNDL